jgi:hypothetical protein
MRRISATVVVACSLFLVACTNTNSPGVATANGAVTSPSKDGAAEEQALQQFAQCMGQHGVSVPDPHNIAPPSGGRDTPSLQKWEEAQNACRALLPGGDLEQGPGDAEMEQLRAFAVCMRAHDIPITDPLPNGNMKINGRFEHVTRTQLEADPVFVEAMAACKDKLPVPAKSPVAHR